MKIRIALLVLVIFFLAWSAFQPNGVLVTVQNNFWAINLQNLLKTEHGQLNQVSLPTFTSHSSVLLARQAIREEQLEFSQSVLLPLLDDQDRVVQGTYAELLYAKGQKIEAIGIWEKLSDTIVLERVGNQSSAEGDRKNLLAAYQSLYQLDQAKYTSSLAFTLKSQGQLKEAEELLIRSRKDFPDSEYKSDWLRYLADIYSANSDWQKAEDVYRQVILENPKDGRAWRNLGLLYTSHLDMPDKAIECFQEMISISPSESYGYSLLAQTYETIGDTEKAISTYQALLVIDPGNTAALEAIERLSDLEP